MNPTPDTHPTTWHVHPDETTIFDKTGIAVASTRIDGRSEPAGAAHDRAVLIVQSVACLPALLKMVAFERIQIASLQRQRDQWQQATFAIADVVRSIVKDLGQHINLDEIEKILTDAVKDLEEGGAK